MKGLVLPSVKVQQTVNYQGRKERVLQTVKVLQRKEGVLQVLEELKKEGKSTRESRNTAERRYYYFRWYK